MSRVRDHVKIHSSPTRRSSDLRWECCGATGSTGPTGSFRSTGSSGPTGVSGSHCPLWPLRGVRTEGTRSEERRVGKEGGERRAQGRRRRKQEAQNDAEQLVRRESRVVCK